MAYIPPEQDLMSGALAAVEKNWDIVERPFTDEFYDRAVAECDSRISLHKSAIRELKESKETFEHFKSVGFRG